MAEVLGIAAFMLALTAIFVGSEALKRTDLRSRSAVEAQTLEIKAAIMENDRRLDVLEKEIRASEIARAKVENTPPASEHGSADSVPGHSDQDRFVPSQYRSSGRDAA